MSKAEESRIARRYANALLDLTDTKAKLDALLSDVKTLTEILESSDILRRVLKDPLVPADQCTAAILSLAKKAKLKPLTQNFLGVLGDNKRLGILDTVLEALKSEISIRKGEIKAEVTSAVKLSKDQLKNITESLKKATGTDVDIDVNVDENIMGGLIIKVGSLQIDHSVKTKLDRLERALKSENSPAQLQEMKDAA